MAHEFAYPVRFTPDETDGGFVVTFGDLPEAMTEGDTIAAALAEAAEGLKAAIAGRIRRGETMPEPSPPADLPMVPVPAQTAAKAALYLALLETGISNHQLAARLGCNEKEVRRLLDPRHPSKLPRIQRALAALGKG